MSAEPLLAHVRLDNAKYLLQTVDGSHTSLGHIIEKSYSLHALHYSETLAFLVALGAVQGETDRIVPGANFTRAIGSLAKGVADFTQLMLELTIGSTSQYGTELRHVLLELSPSRSALTLEPRTARDPLYGARDMLVSAGVVLLDHETGHGTLCPDYHRLYGLAHAHVGVPPERLSVQEKQNHEIGHRAELFVMDYERGVVGARYQNQVVHVAKQSASAGFDISSLRVREASLVESRLIEVKAVSCEDLGFFWSAQEAEVARRSRGTYFLYLVPIRNGDPAGDELVIIRDPVQNVLAASAEWEVDTTGYHCRIRN